MGRTQSWDLILEFQDHALGWRQVLNRWATSYCATNLRTSVHFLCVIIFSLWCGLIISIDLCQVHSPFCSDQSSVKLLNKSFISDITYFKYGNFFQFLLYWNSLCVCTFHCLLRFVYLFICRSFMSPGQDVVANPVCLPLWAWRKWKKKRRGGEMCLSEWRKGLGSKNITSVPLKSFMSFWLVRLQNCCIHQWNFSNTWKIVSCYALVRAGVLKPKLSAFCVFVILCMWT